MNVDFNESKSVLMQFLSMPLSSADEVFKSFSVLPGAQLFEGNKVQERFLYIPGSRKDRVLLVAHADTLWDEAYRGIKYPAELVVEQQLTETDNVVTGQNKELGIGADDRAGCAMLYLLRNSGHSILIMDSEEHFKAAHFFMKDKHKSLLKELNQHQYMLEVDLPGAKRYSSSRISNTRRFEKHIETALGLQTSPGLQRLGTDVTQLCKNICGVNVSCGYTKHHTPQEALHIQKWYETMCSLEGFLAKPQIKFKINYMKIFTKAVSSNVRRVGGKLKRLLKCSRS